jgi:serine/threonine protein kinase
MVQRIQRSQMGNLDRLAQGGQGIVYRAPSARTGFAKSMVYKEYKLGTLASLDVSALEAMPEFLESLQFRDGARLIGLASWPCALVEDGGSITGFVMPSIPQEYFTVFWTSKGPSRVAAEFQHLLNEPQVLAMRFQSGVITDRQRYELLDEVVTALDFLHEHGVCVGDISPKNLLFSLSGSPSVYFLDCDAMRINGISLARQLETPDWEIPSGEEKATPYSDRYKLGLLALRLIVGSQDCRDPALLPTTVPPKLRNVITQTLTSVSEQRPSLRDWENALAEAIVATPPAPLPPPAPHGPATRPTPITSPTPNPPRQPHRPLQIPPPSLPVTTPQASKDSGRTKIWLFVAGGLLSLGVLWGTLGNLNNSETTSSSPSTAARASGIPSGANEGASSTMAPTGGAVSTVYVPVPASPSPPGWAPHTGGGALPPNIAGADAQGFADTTGPRCNFTNEAVAIGRTSISRFVICRTGVGRLYYKGFGLENGLGVEIDDPIPTAGGFTVSNRGVTYRITPEALTISEGGSTLSDEAMLEYWSR